MNYQGVVNRWLSDPSAAIRRIDEAAASLGRLTPDGHGTYQARVIQAFLKQDLPALLRLTAAWTERHRHQIALAARGLALVRNGFADEAVAALEKACVSARAIRSAPNSNTVSHWPTSSPVATNWPAIGI